MTTPSTSTPARAHAGPPRLLLEVIVFVVGMSSLGAEIAAARQLAPWFGASTIVWANTIAITLVSLSIGYALGGRLADRNPTMAGMARYVVVAALLFAAVPFVSGPFLRASVEAFDAYSGGLFLGSLIGVSALIAVPVLLLGVISPYAVRLKVDAVSDAGKTAGRLYAIGTIGSLTGTFGASLLLIPLVGTQRTFLIFALLLALVTIPALGSRWWAGGLASVLIAGLIVAPPGTTKTVTADGARVIKEVDTEYQYARVIQEPDGERTLELNEGQAIHSIYRPGEYLMGGYWDSMLALTFAGEREPERVVNLGSAAGSVARGLHHYDPALKIDAVELDPDVTKIGRELFDLDDAITTHDADARPWLQSQKGPFDAILVDAYRQPYIPFYLTTKEFFEVVRSRLAPGGTVSVNVGHVPGSDDLEKVLTATMASVFGRAHVWRDPVDDTNTILLGTMGDRDPADNLREADLPTDVQTIADEAADRIEPGLRGGTVYTDDRAPVEWLIDLSLADLAQ